MKIAKYLIISSTLVLAGAATAFAAVTETTIESRVYVEQAPGSDIKIMKIMGPDKIEYRIEAPQAEVQRLTTFIAANPNTIVNFKGEVLDERGIRVFRINNWEKTETTTTKVTTDSAGNRAVETQTETVVK